MSRTALGGQRKGLLLAQVELLRDGVVLRVAGGRLRRQPLGHITCIGRCRGGQLRGVHRTLRERLVEPELLTQHHRAGMYRGAQVANEFAHESIEFLRVDCHADLLIE